MTTGELIIVAIFVVAVMCSLSLFWWLRKLIRGERDATRSAGPTQKTD